MSRILPFGRTLKKIPFDAGKSPIFYGWIVLIAGIIGALSSAPGQTIGISVFTDYLIDALQIERSALSFYYMLGTAVSGFLLTHAGMLYDKYGARIVGSIAGLFLGFVLIGFSNIESILAYASQTFSSVKLPLIRAMLLIFLFLCLRFFGQGVLTLVSRNMVMKWFEKNRGFVNMFFGMSISFGFSIAPRIFNGLIDRGSWQSAWLEMGIYSSVIFVAFALIFFRDNPFQFGLKPDGNWKWAQNRKTVPPSIKQFTLREATQSYSFWIYNSTLTIHALYITAFTFHIVSIFETKGFNRDMAVDIFVPVAIVAAFFHFSGSWLSDLIKLRYLLLLYIFGLIISTLGLLNLNHSRIFYYIFILGSGIGSGMFGTLSAVTWPRFYGVKHLGAISGFSQSWVVVGSAFGPYLFSKLYEANNSYSTAILTCLIPLIILFILAMKTKEVHRSKE